MTKYLGTKKKSRRRLSCYLLLGLLLVTGLAIFTIVGFKIFGGSDGYRDAPVLVPPPPQIDLGDVKRILPADSIQAIDEPVFIKANTAEGIMKPDELVIGVLINGEAKAYPINILSVHEIVNDVAGGEAIAVTWCPLCFTALVYSRQVEGLKDPLVFGVSGLLLYESLVMFDRQTGSLWSQLYGGAIDGQLVSRRLAFFPSVLSEWAAWVDEHPDSLVLSKTDICQQFSCSNPTSSAGLSYQADPYRSYYASSDRGRLNDQITRGVNEAGPKRRILGVRLDDIARAYPWDVLREKTVINDEINGTPVLIAYDPEADTAAAYLRSFDGELLSFESDPMNPGSVLDHTSGSRWLVTSGVAIEGPLDGRRLKPLVATIAFEFAWFDAYPRSDMVEFP